MTRKIQFAKTTGTAMLAALAVTLTGPVAAQNGGAAGAPGNAGAGGGAAAAGGGVAAGANGAATGNPGAAGPGAPAGTAAGPGGAANAGNNGNGGANGVAGNAGGLGIGTGAVNGSTGTGVNGALSNGAAPGGSLPLHGTPAPQTYSLQRAITDAVQASADVQTATRNIQIDKKRADNAAAAARPKLNAEAQGTEFDQATKVPFALPGLPPAELTVVGMHTETLSLNLSDAVDIAGEIQAATDQYKLQSLADQFVLQQAVNARTLRAQTVYYEYLQASHQVQVAQANLADEQENLRDAQEQNAAGTGLKLDLLNAQAQVSQAQQQLDQAQNNEAVAEATFNDLVGRPLNTPTSVVDVPGVTVGTPPANNTAVGAPAPNQTLFTPPDTSTIDLTQSVQTALAHRPEILADQVAVRVAGLGIKLARAGLEPTLQFNASGNYYPDTSFEVPRQRTAQISGTLTIPLYDSNATHDLVQAAHLQQDNAQTDLESEQTDVTLDVNQFYLNLVTAAQQIAAANAELQSAIAARQNAEIRYRGGVGLFLEVTDAQARLVQAQNSQITDVYNYLTARAQFENALGTPQAP